MKKLTLILTSLVLIGAFVISCETEPPPVPTGPTIELVNEGGFVVDTASVEAGGTFSIKVTAAAGDSLISTLSVKENGTAIAKERLVFDGFDAGSNPTPISTGAGFTWEIDIVAHSDIDVTSTYTVEITDGANLTDDVSVDITTFDPGTPVAVSEMVMLLNQGGPAGTGGLDLHTGTGTGTQASDTTADIRDMGIDEINFPPETNWLQKIGTINGSMLAVPDANFDFDAITKKEEIVPAFEAGTQITESEKVEVGDAFLVLSQGTYFAIKVTKIEVVTTDNSDFYEFTVKQ